jgi:hypothetical protein
MKWLKFESEMESEMKANNVKKFFEIFNQWVTHMDFPALGKKAKRKYEIFCGGFLYYHDVVFKKYPEGEGLSLDEKGKPFLKKYPHTKFEHRIYFEWLPKGNSKKTSVRIYINETPDEFNVDPPPPPKPPPPEA